ncbi:MAG: hypothetical protein KBB86_00465 [Candidatus Pacebacteria bacterium]|nr:hypothetical protein [Candidatus Paceibacterota bacterium]
MEIKVDTTEQDQILAGLLARNDAESLRMQRYLAMADLSRTEGSPLYEMVKRIKVLDEFKDFDVIEVPEVVSTEIGFDLFDFPADHPARSKSDTYYINETHILRTQMTVMWYYYLNNENIKNKMANNEAVGCFAHGKVYRKDEIDRRHMNIFHQLDGWYLIPKEKGTITRTDLERVLTETVLAVFGNDTKYRFNPDTFPYTDPSLEMEIEVDGKWVEVNGAGVVRASVLEKLGIDSTKWTGWAFGLGLERLAIISTQLPDIRLLWSSDERVKKQLVLGNIYKEVSRYPAVIRDISFVVSKTFSPNDYFDLVRDVLGDMAEEVALMDEYENDAKFGADKKSYAYRITYRSLDRTLTDDEVNTLHKQLETKTTEVFGATIR